MLLSTYTTGNKEETIIDKPKEEETVKAEPRNKIIKIIMSIHLLQAQRFGRA
jgi:hypothetical protein